MTPVDHVPEPYGDWRHYETFSPKFLHAVDARYSSGDRLCDPHRLTEIAREAVAAGEGHCLEDALVVFPNGAVTLVLVLAESHLSIHTWPEENLIAIDLFSCGKINGEAVISSLVMQLGLERVRRRTIKRDLLDSD